ncbi:hypothetical protein WOLCODRAFT_135005 [Wolfiporia cocos MD-104 SS10]|uniref:Uncharacterized protein n=1 Tax=Wolfiporia cocos (strain MD-104) TaxID=742152 RepID=A0A2H3JB99_WOLCO|nr:hypothetical protein WOLCODRAFT_135005 [Wolfiporia cocos MD-104 SS10]
MSAGAGKSARDKPGTSNKGAREVGNAPNFMMQAAAGRRAIDEKRRRRHRKREGVTEPTPFCAYCDPRHRHARPRCDACLFGRQHCGKGRRRVSFGCDMGAGSLKRYLQSLRAGMTLWT